MNKCSIIIKRFWYGPELTTSTFTDENNRMWTGTRKEAETLIEELDSQVYELSHNEYARPEYFIVNETKPRG